MSTMIFAFLVMLLLTAAMAIGVIAGRKPIAGSCGGMKAMGLGTSCEVCGGDPARCERTGERADREGTSLGVDATRRGELH
jgi:hypothetical protein